MRYVSSGLDPDDRTFVRIYRLPPNLTDGYCFDGGVPIMMQNVDWFEAVISAGRHALTEHVRRKRYYDSAHRFLVLGDHPEFTFVIEPPERGPLPRRRP